MAPSAVFPPTDLFAMAAEANVRQDYYSTGLRSRFRLDANRAVAPVGVKYANIGYEVDEAAFRRRAAARLAAGGLATTVPEGWPTRVEGPLVWSGDDFDGEEEDYVYHLTDQDRAEIADALEYFKQQGLEGNEVSPANFPLPTLGTKLHAVCADIYEGRGFAIVRGLEPDAYAVEDLTVVYLGISSYVGERRGKQDQRGSMLMHVIKRDDATQDSEDKPFHTDTVTDCLCLFTQNLAEKGGRSVISSAWTVYNELAATRPDLIHVLSAPDWPFDTFQRNPSYYTRPVLFHHNTKIIMSFSRRLLVGHEPKETRTPGIPGLTEAQADAIDAVHFIARKHEFKPAMARGDLRFINNMGVLHRREAFTNGGPDGAGAGAGAARHLVRVWLNNPSMCWQLPRPLRIAWARIFDDAEREEHWDIEPPRLNGKLLHVAGSCD
ncbi:bfedabf7-3ea8-4d81-ab25-88f44eff35b9 [Parachaetomium inaequale]|uniref:Bfedabf7-3ea8-4d81-ab25-88f44eff35b9 n=1 Tax=Parachaetomium inaequale TaxID=2588326 RepID=A0AAN6SNC9_9PEZI|nr:bfedabf7-3ea8-4d81-ab25-88f44eff35b9 [Parachaetomium inaequale]